VIVIGAPSENGGVGDPIPGSGAAYVFQRTQGDPDEWSEVKILRASDAQMFDWLGSSVSISGDVIVVGATGEAGGVGDPLPYSGAAYVFQHTQGEPVEWGEVQILRASDAQTDDHFGDSAAISGDVIVVGAYGEDGGLGDPIPESGAAYVFQSYPDPPTQVTISGPESGYTNYSYDFSAIVEPISTTLPLTYTWQADMQMPITHTSGLSDTVSFVWEMPGTYAITVTTSNLAGEVSDSHVIKISPPIYNTYLPLVIKSSSGILTPTQPSSLIFSGAWIGLVIVGIVGMRKRR
jgi:hypothetical protein